VRALADGLTFTGLGSSGGCVHLLGVSCVSTCARAANAVFDECLLGVGVDPRVDRLMANRVALSIGRSIHGGQCATRLLTQAVR